MQPFGAGERIVATLRWNPPQPGRDVFTNPRKDAAGGRETKG